VKSHCGIATTTTTYDNDIIDAINFASRYIDALTGRYYFKLSISSEYLNGTKDYQGWQIIQNSNGGLIFTPKAAPIIDITELIESEDTLVENTDFYIHKENGIIERAAGNWDESPRSIKITGTLGYASADTATPSVDIPGDIVFYCIEIAARKSGHYKKEIKNYVSGASEAVDLFGVPKEIEKALRDLRQVIIA
jgi:hypothetical protein